MKNGEEFTKLYLKSAVTLLADLFEKFVKVSTEEYGINLLYFIFLPGYTYECALKYTDIKLQTLQDKDLILLGENITRGVLSSVLGDRYVKSDKYKKILYADANNLYGHSRSQMLTFDEIEMWHGHPDLYMGILADFLNTPDDSGIGYFIDVDLKYPDNIKKNKETSICS